MNIFNDDFLEFLSAFDHQEVEYILVGGMAVILHGYPRTTGDMDLWVKKDANNYKKIVAAFKEFRMPLFDMTKKRFLSNEFDVWIFGVSPVRIELMTEVKGLDFDEAHAISETLIERKVRIRFLHLNSLISAKRASGRPKDIEDINQLLKGIDDNG